MCAPWPKEDPVREGGEAEQRIQPSVPLELLTPGTGPFLALILQDFNAFCQFVARFKF